MRRQSLLLRLVFTLVAAWYAAIAGGQLSLAENVLGPSQLSSVHDEVRASQSARSSPQTASVMAGMDCHGPSVPGAPKHPCTCIDLGCQNVAAPAAIPATTLCVAPAEVRDERPVCSLTYDYISPPHTLPFAHGPPRLALL